MTKKEFIELFNSTESRLSEIQGDNAFLGLLILSKYSNDLICAAEHDIIYSTDIDELLENEITKEDVIRLAELNWGIEDNSYLYCFV